MTDRIEKILLTVVCCVMMFFPRIAYDDYIPDMDVEKWHSHLLYHFSHANVFHLAGNLICLWIMRVRVRAVCAWACASVASVLPYTVWSWRDMCLTALPTLGMSGMIFASLGFAWACYGTWRQVMTRVMPVIFVTGMIPNINLLIHLYSFLIAYGAALVWRHSMK